MNTEICVVGGGPAGSVIALRLAELGHDVCVFEKAAFPRPHVGESLTPGVLPLLEMIGLRERVEEAGFLRPSRAFVDWGNEIRHDMPSPGPAGFQVDRGRFDKLLLDGAAEAGVRVLQPAAAQKPVHQAPNGWRIKANWNGQATHIDAKFLVQASGRLSLLPGRKRKCGQPTIALYAYWNGEAFEGPETRIEAGRRQWYWGAPLPDGSFNATVFVDPGHCRTHGRRLENVYFTLLDESRLLRSCLHVPIIRQPKACDATCYAAEDVVGKDWIRVGEASFSIDPLSSQGVQEALVTALQGSAVVHTMLARSGDADAAIQFYRQRQAEHVERHAKWAAAFYAEQAAHTSTPFWQSRAAPEKPAASNSRPDLNRLPLSPATRLRLSDHVSVIDVPVLEGNLVRRRPALTSSLLDRPVAFVDDIALAPFIDQFGTGTLASELLQAWSRKHGPTVSRRILTWLWQNRILVSCDSRLDLDTHSTSN